MPLVCGLFVLVRAIDVLDGEVELVFVMLRIAAILGAAVGQDPVQRDDPRIEERHQAIIQQFGRRDRRLAIIQLGERHLQ